MTTTLPRRTTATGASAVTWHETGPGMWTSRTGKDIAGAVQLVGTFITTNARGDVVGTFDTLPQAQAALTAPSAHPGRPRSLSRRLLPWSHGR
ncbi:hypothetical protein F1C15_15655 (plasmid) [Frigoribacterium sp. NBH87]|uniref:hypothetical protein n=1 Tax=Frigoribacterium sp. NBH87 TaxID=2596916 RepID=UPI00162A5683|nr:hypothetical protein [Frigoribacterium sp. NBH87]QNE45407.1 hypothetical protein F1C15_15655 [Frigoribacterium sp. NBH87]